MNIVSFKPTALFFGESPINKGRMVDIDLRAPANTFPMATACDAGNSTVWDASPSPSSVFSTFHLTVDCAEVRGSFFNWSLQNGAMSFFLLSNRICILLQVATGRTNVPVLVAKGILVRQLTQVCFSIRSRRTAAKRTFPPSHSETNRLPRRVVDDSE